MEQFNGPVMYFDIIVPWQRNMVVLLLIQLLLKTETWSTDKSYHLPTQDSWWVFVLRMLNANMITVTT